jgi:hypothetical protein
VQQQHGHADAGCADEGQQQRVHAVQVEVPVAEADLNLQWQVCIDRREPAEHDQRRVREPRRGTDVRRRLLQLTSVAEVVEVEAGAVGKDALGGDGATIARVREATRKRSALPSVPLSH